MSNRPDRSLLKLGVSKRLGSGKSLGRDGHQRAMNYHRAQFRDVQNKNNGKQRLNHSDSNTQPASSRVTDSHPSYFHSSSFMRPLPPIGSGIYMAARSAASGYCYQRVPPSNLSTDSTLTVYPHIIRAAHSTMGQTLSEPVTTKFSSKHENSFAKVGSSCMQGWRINMEDAHSHLLSLPNDKDACFFGVFDGHGGVKVAQYAGNNLHKKIVSQASYSKGNLAEALRHGFLALDEEMLKDETMKDELAGTTAVVVLIKHGRIYCANVGDSRAVASVHGEVEQLSFDHKPSNESETRRIIAAGGWVEFNRVNGNLALSRALGDFVFKKNDKKRVEEQIVTANPDVIEKPLTPDHEFMVLACDGIWDVLTNQEVVEFVRNRIAQRMEPDIICEELMTRCLAPDCQAGGLGCDNMTVVLVCFLHGGTYDDLVRKCARPSRGGPAPHLRDYHGGLVFK